MFIYQMVKEDVVDQTGLSENVGLIFPMIASHLISRDNDHENHWVKRGTRHFQTNPNVGFTAVFYGLTCGFKMLQDVQFGTIVMLNHHWILRVWYFWNFWMSHYHYLSLLARTSQTLELSPHPCLFLFPSWDDMTGWWSTWTWTEWWMVAATFATSTCLGRGSPRWPPPGGLPQVASPNGHGSRVPRPGLRWRRCSTGWRIWMAPSLRWAWNVEKSSLTLAGWVLLGALEHGFYFPFSWEKWFSWEEWSQLTNSYFSEG